MSENRTNPLNRRTLIAGAGAAAASAIAASASTSSATASAASTRYHAPFLHLQETAELTFAYWGSPQEQEAVGQMIDGFNAEHPNIRVTPLYIPNDNYNERITTLIAGGDLPDISYQDSTFAFRLAEDGQALDLKQWVDADPETPTLLPNTTYTWDDGKVLSTSLAIGIQLLFFNRDLFDAAGVDVPPLTGDAAWTWDEFVEVARQLTRDTSGRDANDPDFDPDSIDVYGTNVPQWLEQVWSRGGDLTNEDGTELTLNFPEAIDAIQRLQDLIYVHRVAPTPLISASLPATDILLRTGKLAIDNNGTWKVLDYAASDELNWGVGVLPHGGTPITRRFGIPIVVSAATANPDAAYEFYRWRYSPDRIDLYERGLWQPIQTAYYENEEDILKWVDPSKGVYPEGGREVFVDYTLDFAPKQLPDYSLRNQERLYTEVIDPAFEALWANEGNAEDLFATAAEQASDVLEGRY